ncbi:MAG: tRNA lysidine(34) synthetase TilS [Candidatus Margulisiibacteriota bacterium]
MLRNKFLETIKEYKMIEPGDSILVAFSGGPDSLALLYLLNSIKEEYKLSLHIAHLNHMLRKQDAELDARFVETIASKLSIPFTIKAVDVNEVAKKKKMGMEAAAREVRYDFFEEVSVRIKANKIAVGHNADDNVETFLMRLLRGAGIKGLCGIPPKRNMIIRPLIRIWRREIEDYIGGLKIIPRRDHTNYESIYMRNSVRLKLIPQLKIYNLNIKEIILQTILLLTEDKLYLEKEAADALKKIMNSQNENEICLSLAKLKELDSPIQGHLLRLAIEKLKGDMDRLSYVHVREIIEKIDAGKKWELHLPGGVYVSGDKNELKISTEWPEENVDKPFNYSLSVPGETAIIEAGCRIRSSFADKVDERDESKIAFLDYDSLGKEVVARSRKTGDRFFPLGMKGSKKIQDFFVDEKVPADKREMIPLIESAGKIVWVAGMRLDERAKVTEKTKKIVKIELL